MGHAAAFAGQHSARRRKKPPRRDPTASSRRRETSLGGVERRGLSFESKNARPVAAAASDSRRREEVRFAGAARTLHGGAPVEVGREMTSLCRGTGGLGK